MIDFDATRHEYRVEGRVVPAVSSILRATLPDPYVCVDTQALAAARERGKRVDAALQRIAAGEIVTDSEIRGYVDSYQAWVRATGWRCIAVQPPLYSRALKVAGTPDEVGWLHGRLTILDNKAIAAFQDKIRYQLAAYAIMWEEMHGKPVHSARALLVQANGRIAKAVPVDLAIYKPQFVRLVREWERQNGANEPT